MAITDTRAATITRQRELHDLMEKFIGNRRRAFIPRSRQIATEAGLEEATLPFLAHLRQIAEGDFVPLERIRRRLSYASRERWRARFEDLGVKGLVAEAEGGWRLTAQGLQLIDRVWTAVYAQLRALPLPAAELRRTVDALDGIVRDAQADEYARLTMIRRCAPADRRSTPDAERVEQLMFETCVLLDDGHIGAWRAAGYRGPVLDVLTKAWYGASTREALRKALDYSQEAADVDRHTTELVERGDLALSGDEVALTDQGRATRERIEEETNRVGLSRWPTGDELERLIADVGALVAALPPEDDLPKGPTH